MCVAGRVAMQQPSHQRCGMQRQPLAAARRVLHFHCNLWGSWRAPQAGGPTRTAAIQAAAASPTAAPPPVVILGIESSCDDTAAAVITSSGRVLGEAIASQADIHAAWGGVVPALAQQAHREAIDRVVDEALAASGMQLQQLDAIAVTIGPGLSLCLEVGVRKARALSRQAQLPLVPVHHMEAHALVARMASPGPGGALRFPFLCLLVSGGHNLLVLVRGVGDYVQLGTTLDDAIGEAYDKIARMLGLEMNPHGGAALERLARQGDPHRFKFAVPMKKHANCDFSFAGLKTSVRLCIEKELGGAAGAGKSAARPGSAPGAASSSSSSSAGAGAPDGAPPAAAAPGLQQQRAPSPVLFDPPPGLPLAPTPPQQQQQEQQQQQQQTKADIAASFQRVAVEHLMARVKRGLAWAQEECPQLTTLVVAGGVAANQYIRQQLTQVADAAGVKLEVPPPRWCTDNGVMVAWAGYERWCLGLVGPPAAALPEDGLERVELRPRWPLTSAKHRGSTPQTLSMKSPDKLHASLTDLTQQELLQRPQQRQERQEQEQQQQQRELQVEEQPPAYAPQPQQLVAGPAGSSSSSICPSGSSPP